MHDKRLVSLMHTIKLHQDVMVDKDRLDNLYWVIPHLQQANKPKKT